MRLLCDNGVLDGMSVTANSVIQNQSVAAWPTGHNHVLWKLILLLLVCQSGTVVPSIALAQHTPITQTDSLIARADSIGIVAMTNKPVLERTLDAVITAGYGFYNNGLATVSEPTANLDFFAQTSLLNLMAGVHIGLRSPTTGSVNLGLRLPISGNDRSGIYGDIGLLFFDAGDSNEFSTGVRAAIATRYAPLAMEFRIAGELRSVFASHLQAWGGVELGWYLNLMRDPIHNPTRNDTLRAELQYIMTAEDRAELARATTDDEMDVFLSRFWKSREDHGFDFRAEYERRIAVADSAFGSIHRMGVETDQGRVVLLYGQPNQIESVASAVEPTRRYQLWTYESRVRGYRTALFLFYTTLGQTSNWHGNYQEIYSNIPGEPTQPLPYDLPTTMYNYITSF